MGQIWPAQPTPTQLSRAGSPPNRGAGELRCVVAPAESGGLLTVRGVGVAAKAGRRCGRMILGLREDRGSPERAHDSNGGWPEEFASERCGGTLISEDGEVDELSQGAVVLGEAKTRWEMGCRGFEPGRSSRSRKAVGAGSLRWLLMIML
jgi:hypothetical protein